MKSVKGQGTVLAENLMTYISATEKCFNEHVAEPAELMPLVVETDDFLRREFFENHNQKSTLPSILAANSYALWMNSVRQVLSGHVAAVHPVSRSAIESACFALIMTNDPTTEPIWLKRHESKTAREKCRKTYTFAESKRLLRSKSTELAGYVEHIYDAAIDFGAHPNVRSIAPHLESRGQTSSGLFQIDFTVVYSRNNWEINRHLLSCVETAHALVFILSCIESDHPLLSSRADDFQRFINKKMHFVKDYFEFDIAD